MKATWHGWWTELRFLIATYLVRWLIWITPENHPDGQALLAALVVWAAMSLTRERK